MSNIVDSLSIQNKETGAYAAYSIQDSTLKARVDSFMTDINARVLDEIASRKLSDDVICARMDAFTNLPSGSTAGDAELIDGRVGDNAITYSCIGDAIRGQYRDIKNEIYLDLFSERTNQLLDWYNIAKYNCFVNSQTNKLSPRADCKMFFIDVSMYKGKKICISKSKLSRFQISTFGEMPTKFDASESPMRVYSLFENLTGEITIEENENILGVWYFWSEVDTNVTADEIIKDMMVSIDTYQAYQPYRVPKMFNNVNKATANPLNPAYFDFNNEIYLKPNNVFIYRSPEDNDLVNAPNGDTWGGFGVLSNVLNDTYSRCVILQLVYSMDSKSYHNDIGKLYIRYLVWDKINKCYTNLNENNGQWHDLNNINAKMLSHDVEEKGVFPICDYVGKSPADKNVYITNYVYTKGFIKNINIKTIDDNDTTANVYFIKKLDGTVLRHYSINGHGLLNIRVNEYINHDFYVAIHCPNCAFINSDTSEYKWGNSTNINPGLLTCKQGDIVNVDFRDDGFYSLAITLNYANTFEMVYESDTSNTVTNNEMFVAGDSITAGHPSYAEGEHWWEAVARAFNYKVKIGARNGSGLVFYNGNSGCKIAKNTDFSKYNIAVFAFGTNDYGNNMPLGTIDDNYTYTEDNSKATFYGGLKYVIDTIMESNPKITLIFALPINRCDNRGTKANNFAFNYRNSAGHTLGEYCDAIVNVCKRYGIPYIDRRQSAFNAYTIPYLLCDALHPSAEGYKVLGQEMVARLGAIIQPYPEYNGVGGYGKDW